MECNMGIMEEMLDSFRSKEGIGEGLLGVNGL